MRASDITALGAVDLSQLIHSRKVSCVDVMAAYLARIDALNPVYNAIVLRRDTEELIRAAQRCDQELMDGHSRGWMHGIPIAIKDTAHVAGMPTTLGHAALASHVVSEDSPMVARMRAAGALFIGKTNVPEFALGSHTFNNVFGTTLNAYNPTKSAGGSSGGAAVALATRMLPVADGSDFMGSLRNPAAWNNVFGLRPSQGLVPFAPGPDVWIDQLGTEGPMARHVRDLRALLLTQSGYHAGRPLSWSLGAEQLQHPAIKDLSGVRVGWLGDLNGHLATESGIIEACEAGLAHMQAAGATVHPLTLDLDLDDVWKAWLIWRSALVGSKVKAVMQIKGARELTKPEALWEVAQSEHHSIGDLLWASATRTRLYNTLRLALESVDVLVLPSVQVWAFDIEKRWPEHIGHRPMDTYHRWMEATIYATFAGLPAISLPVGFHTEDRTAMGMQCIGQPRGDLKLLDISEVYEKTVTYLLDARPNISEY